MNHRNEITHITKNLKSYKNRTPKMLYFFKNLLILIHETFSLTLYVILSGIYMMCI
jgi:hypothetical protein